MNTINEIKNYAKLNHVPIIRDNTLNALLQQVTKCNVFNILEIGTAIGYSGICMLNANKHATLTTIEKSKQMLELAINNFAKTHLLSRVNIIHNDAMLELKKLANSNKKFDIIFLDGPKGQYINYLSTIKKLMHTNTILFTDDVLIGQGLTNKHNTIKNRLAQYLQAINQPPFTSVVFDIDDGYAITKLL